MLRHLQGDCWSLIPILKTLGKLTPLNLQQALEVQQGLFAFPALICPDLVVKSLGKMKPSLALHALCGLSETYHGRDHPTHCTCVLLYCAQHPKGQRITFKKQRTHLSCSAVLVPSLAFEGGYGFLLSGHLAGFSRFVPHTHRRKISSWPLATKQQ